MKKTHLVESHFSFVFEQFVSDAPSGKLWKRRLPRAKNAVIQSGDCDSHSVYEITAESLILYTEWCYAKFRFEEGFGVLCFTLAISSALNMPRRQQVYQWALEMTEIVAFNFGDIPTCVVSSKWRWSVQMTERQNWTRFRVDNCNCCNRCCSALTPIQALTILGYCWKLWTMYVFVLRLVDASHAYTECIKNTC